MKLHILVDGIMNEKFFLEKEFSSMGIECKTYDIPNYSMQDRTKRLRIFILYFKYIQLAYRAIRSSEENDILICWNFTTSIAAGYLCKILNKRRIILGLNLIAVPRKRIIEKLRKWVFHPVMSMATFHITVNSELYIEEYSQRFEIDKGKFHVLNDPMRSTDINYAFTPIKSYVFAGGEGHRDWETLFQASEYCSEINFVCIARKKFFNFSLRIPSNVKLLFDTDHKTFYDYMDKSSLVVIPLESQLPSGLIILLRAATIQKPIIATNTPSIRNYIENEVSGLLFEQGNSQELAQKIKLLFHDIELQKKLTANLIKHCTKNFSQGNYAKNLVKIVYNILGNKL